MIHCYFYYLSLIGIYKVLWLGTQSSLTNKNKQKNNEISHSSIAMQKEETKEQESDDCIKSEDSDHILSQIQRENDDLIEENDTLSQRIDELMQTMNNQKQNAQECSNKNCNECLLKQKEIESLRSELIIRSDAKQIHSEFPTVEEVCNAFRSLKNQEFQSVHALLTKRLKKMDKTMNKYYLNQMSHNLLFEILIECYNETNEYLNLIIYESMADILLMESDDDNDANILQFLFHRYLTTNYEKFNENLKIKHGVVLKILNDSLTKINDKLSISEIDDDLKNVLNEFISKCCSICWTMVLQTPKLSISPETYGIEKDTKFNENKHLRQYGSNKKHANVLYVVWPGIAQNDILLDNVKVCVIQRDEAFPKYKGKKKA